MPVPLLQLRPGAQVPPELYNDFQKETLKDRENGQLYGLEKFWAFIKYYRYADQLHVLPKLKEQLEPFKTIEDFKILYMEEETGKRSRNQSFSQSGSGRHMSGRSNSGGGGHHHSPHCLQGRQLDRADGEGASLLRREALLGNLWELIGGSAPCRVVDARGSSPRGSRAGRCSKKVKYVVRLCLRIIFSPFV